MLRVEAGHAPPKSFLVDQVRVVFPTLFRLIFGLVEESEAMEALVPEIHYNKRVR